MFKTSDPELFIKLITWGWFEASRMKAIRHSGGPVKIERAISLTFETRTGCILGMAVWLIRFRQFSLRTKKHKTKRCYKVMVYFKYFFVVN